MSWGSHVNFNIKINQKPINEVFGKEELISYVSEISSFRFDISSKISNSIFFDDLYYYLSFSKKSKWFKSNFSIIIDTSFNGAPLVSPVDVFEILIFYQFLSTKLSGDKIYITIGDLELVKLDICFFNGKVNQIKVKASKDLKNNRIDSFYCNKEELLDFFNISLNERISLDTPNKINTKSKPHSRDKLLSGTALGQVVDEINQDDQLEIIIDNHNYRDYDALDQSRRYDIKLTHSVMNFIMSEFDPNTDKIIAIKLLQSLRYNKDEKLFSFINWLIPIFKGHNLELGEMYFYRAEVFQSLGKINEYLLDIKKSILLQKAQLAMYIDEYSKYWSIELFIETLTNFSLFELGLTDKSDIDLIDIKSVSNNLTEKICFRGRFIYECKSVKLKELLIKVCESQSKEEVISKLKEVKNIDWLSSSSDRLQLPILYINKELYLDKDIKKLSTKICPDSQFYFIQNNKDAIKYASKNPILYDVLPFDMKLNLEIVISNLTSTHDTSAYVKMIPSELFETKADVIKMCNVNGKIYSLLPKQYLDDIDIILSCVKQNHFVVNDISSIYLDDQCFVKKLLSVNGRCILRLNPSILKDKELVVKALKNIENLYEWEFIKITLNFNDDQEIQSLRPLL